MLKKKNLEWRNCSESELSSNIKNWLKTVDLRNSVIFLEGEMGAGKSTFARALLAELAPNQRSMGSPTFPLVQQYQADDYVVYHIDLYRLKSDAELTDSGLESQIDETGSTALVEWGSMFEESCAHWFNEERRLRKNVFRIHIDATSDGLVRNFMLEWRMNQT